MTYFSPQMVYFSTTILNADSGKNNYSYMIGEPVVYCIMLHACKSAGTTRSPRDYQLQMVTNIIGPLQISTLVKNKFLKGTKILFNSSQYCSLKRYESSTNLTKNSRWNFEGFLLIHIEQICPTLTPHSPRSKCAWKQRASNHPKKLQ